MCSDRSSNVSGNGQWSIMSTVVTYFKWNDEVFYPVRKTQNSDFDGVAELRWASLERFSWSD